MNRRAVQLLSGRKGGHSAKTLARHELSSPKARARAKAAEFESGVYLEGSVFWCSDYLGGSISSRSSYYAYMKLSLLAVSVVLLWGCSGNDNGQGSSKSSLELTTMFYEGSYELSGKVTFSSAVPQGTGLQMILTKASDIRSGGLNMGNEIVNGHMATTGTEVDWAVHAIAAGEYWVSVAADTSGNNEIGEGDLGGYYAGTIAQAVQFQADATTISVTNASLTSLDFGAGAIKCLANWGDACTTNADCRGASCVYPSSLRTTAVSGSCTGNVCATPVYTCTAMSGSAGTLQPSQCFGDP